MGLDPEHQPLLQLIHTTKIYHATYSKTAGDNHSRKKRDNHRLSSSVSSSNPCPIYVGVGNMNYVSPFQSILNQILEYVALLHIYCYHFLSCPLWPTPSHWWAISLHREASPPGHCWPTVDMSKPSQTVLLFYHLLMIPLNALESTQF